ncbi:MAG: sugar ABC transporter permease [Spirochaetales bacterium]|nr:sugar ABC transporter permease [Spirochaetales bacterium]
MSNKQSMTKARLNIDLRRYMMIIALLGIWVIFTILSEGIFLSPRNISNLFRQSVFTAILALGMVFVIICGHIDLSVGSIAGLAGGILAILNVRQGLSPAVSIVAALAVGLALGAWNGYWVAYRGVPSFIVTMAGLLIFRGVLTGITDGVTIGPVSPFFNLVGKEFLPPQVGIAIGAVFIILLLIFQYRERRSRSRYGFTVTPLPWEIARSAVVAALVLVFVLVMNAYNGVPNPVLGLLALFAVFNYVAGRTVFGRRVYAVGGNRLAARLAGVDIAKLTFLVFAVNGLMASLGGVYMTSRLSSAAVNAGANTELDAIAACVIGGTSLMGGIGTVTGAIIGAVVMASLDNGMSLLDAPFFWQTIVKGLVLLLAVWFDMSKKRNEV